jgi:transcriptional regulator with XRE-family HTH domain
MTLCQTGFDRPNAYKRAHLAFEVFRQNLPLNVYAPTAWGEIEDFDETIEEGPVYEEDNGPLPQIIAYTTPQAVAQDPSITLRAFHEQSGLTWNQIADLIGVSVRMVHFWIKGQRKMPSEPADVLEHLAKVVAIIDRGPVYKTRKVLERGLLSESSLLKALKKRDFDPIEEWAKQIQITKRPAPLPISAMAFNARLPESAATFASSVDESEPTPQLGRAQRARIARKRKKP